MKRNIPHTRIWVCTARLLLAAAAGTLLQPPLSGASQAVRVWEEETVLPTYFAGPPEPSPLFFFGRSSQGAQAPVYPYPMYDVLTGKKADKRYKLVCLENEYIRVCIMPEIGGRIFEGVDKTNNYHFFYRQHVIKPALIGLLGAWISGGVEWNIPHHHRASTFIPVQHSIEEHADGGRTVWVGELELRHRTRWAVGYTMRPGKAWLEASVRIVNRTPVTMSMLCFANVAVHANDDYQIIFPPSTQYGTGHSKRVFHRWPVPETFPGIEPGRKVDISWYKNHISSASVFAWNYEDDFLAGYDHGKRAGTMSVADHNVVPGKKFFTWGTGLAGRYWDGVLTDTDGPYLELMVGAYSDNQPDYSVMQPFETRSFSMSWYPFRDIGGVKNANLDAAVNLEVSGGTAKVGFYTTSARPGAVAALKAGSKVLLEEKVAIDPGKPYIRQVPVPAGISEHDLVATLSEGGKELISYSPVRLKPEPMPAGTTRPPAPSEVKTIEELYLIGLRAQQFHDPAIDPMPYWREALRRDPGDTRVNTALGITAYRKARYEEAEAHFRKAIGRLTDQYTSPKDCEAFYYLGLTLKAAGKTEEAQKHLHQAAWSAHWKGPAYYTLAEIAAAGGAWSAAREFVERAIQSDALNIRAQNLKAAILRHTGNPEEALGILASAAPQADPLDVRAMAERWLASKTAPEAKVLFATMNEHPATAQEVAAEYLNAGLWRDGLDVLAGAVAASPDRSRINAMVYYYLGYFAGKLGMAAQAPEYYALARTMEPDYVFPFQQEAIPVLRAAMKANPRDARAPYYLGNLLYDWQPEESLKLWTQAAALDPAFAMVHRNLATAYMHREPGGEIEKAIAALETAISQKRKYALHFTELDELYAQTGAALEKRLAIFEKHPEVVEQRDDSYYRAIVLKLAAGKYDEGIAMMARRSFAVAEGANLNVSEQWTSAHLLRGRKHIAAKRYAEALRDLQAAAEPPSHIPPGRSGRANAAERQAELAYWRGVVHELMGEGERATALWKQGVGQAGDGPRGAAPVGGGPPVTWGSSAVGAGSMAEAGRGAQVYYQALCYLKLGQAGKARELFEGLVASGERALKNVNDPAPARGSRRTRLSPRAWMAEAHYNIGLGYLGLNDRQKAKAELARAVEASPEHLGARAALDECR